VFDLGREVDGAPRLGGSPTRPRKLATRTPRYQVNYFT
jgi:hypothetical protein